MVPPTITASGSKPTGTRRNRAGHDKPRVLIVFRHPIGVESELLAAPGDCVTAIGFAVPGSTAPSPDRPNTKTRIHLRALRSDFCRQVSVTMSNDNCDCIAS